MKSNDYLKVKDFEILSKDKLLATVHIDLPTDTVEVRQFAVNPFDRVFPVEPVTLDKVYKFIESRCFPSDRVNKDQLLKDLGLSKYSPWAIVRKTHGLQLEDFIWIRFKGENLTWKDVKVRG